MFKPCAEKSARTVLGGRKSERKLDNFLKNLEDKKARMRQDSITVANSVFKNKENQATTEPAKGREQCHRRRK